MPIKTRLVMAGLLSTKSPHRQNLINYFGRSEIAVQTFLSRETKTAILGTAYLRRKAEGIVIRFGDEHAFNDFAIGQAKGKFFTAVTGLLPFH